MAPIISTGGSFIEWTADFDAPASAQARWHTLFVQEFGKSLERLRRIVSNAKPLAVSG